MADRIVEHRDTSSSTGAVLGIIFVLLLVGVALFLALGGPSRFAGSPTPNQTNVNVPSQSQPQSAPNVDVPRQIDVNVNQQPAQQAPAPNR